MPSVLVSTGADYLMYGMGEVTLTQMLNNFKAGLHLKDMHDLARHMLPHGAGEHSDRRGAVRQLRDSPR